MSKQTEANLREWVAALDSGEYEQAREELKKPDAERFCCLGVWCDVRPGGEWDVDGNYRVDDEQILEDGELGPLKDELGLSDEEEAYYIHLNDKSKRNFAYIAGRIRKRHPEVFA